jgi:4-amino-4-deoxy-L-arabinose transferase-like glycosyltransferase
MNDVFEPTLAKKFKKYSVVTLVFLLVCRLIAMYVMPLTDTTEARYGEIARKMLETGNWITPLHDYGVPFWAKPPLSFWLSSLSMKYFGVNEFAARLPSLFFSLAILWLVWIVVKKHSGSIVAITTVLVLSSTLAFIADAGAVMTDPSLLFCITLTMVSFWQAVVENNKRWAYLFFTGLGIGLLAKGPVVGVLSGMPIFLWIVFHQKWRDTWKRLPWFTGILLMLAIALPWYILAEKHTPGFLNYFILGEHFGRFLHQGWEGDKYGFAHAAPHGMIWVYALGGICPWVVGSLTWLIYNAKKLPKLCQDNDGWFSYWLLCFLMPLLFFTCATNIIWPYVLPSMPAFAILFAQSYHKSPIAMQLKTSLVYIAAITGLVFLITSVLYVFEPEVVSKSEKPIILAWKETNPAPGSVLFVWADTYSTENHSGKFYAAGSIQTISDLKELTDVFSQKNDADIVLDTETYELIPKTMANHLHIIKTFAIPDHVLMLYHYSNGK